MNCLFFIPVILGFGTIIFIALFLKKKNSGDEKMQEISSIIQSGSRAFLKEVYKILIIFGIIVFFILLFINWKIAFAFLLGSFSSALAGNLGMRVATAANAKTAEGVKKDLLNGLRIALSAGAMMGLLVVSLGILGILILYFLFKDPFIIYGFGFGASTIAIFARVGGGLYTKAADIGADLVGKVELDLPEDDPRNPAVIADNVGDNVGDVAGMGADLFESYVDALIATMALGTLSVPIFGEKLVILPLILAGFGIIASIIGYFSIFFVRLKNPSQNLNFGVWIASGLFIIFSFFFIKKFFSNDLSYFFATLVGLIIGLLIGFSSEFFTSYSFPPTKKIAQAAEQGAAPNLIMGLANGMKSTLLPVILVTLAMIFVYKLAGTYGIALSGVGLLATLGITLATDCYGPVADNAAGIAEMAQLGKEVRERAETLDALGNTTAAIGKGFAISSAALTALALINGYLQTANLGSLDLKEAKTLGGLFLGALLPFLTSALILEAVGKSASQVVEEVRRQFREIPGLKEGKAKPDYQNCVAKITRSALYQMIPPALIAIFTPLIVGLLLGKLALGGLLIGALISGFLLALLMANSGGSWDNAKKYIEAGYLGGKGSNSHKAAVIGDTVGDPLKDTAGPSLNILIKLISIIAILIAPFL